MQRQKYRWPLSCTRVLEHMTIVVVLRARIPNPRVSFHEPIPPSSPLVTLTFILVTNSQEYQLRPPVKSPRHLDQWFSLANQSSREWLAEEEEAAFFLCDFQSIWMLVRPHRSFVFETVCYFIFYFLKIGSLTHGFSSHWWVTLTLNP
jgi:hypothetical protein